MGDVNPNRPRVRLALGLLGLALLGGVGTWLCFGGGEGASRRLEALELAAATPTPSEAAQEEVARVCGVCHAVPPADCLPRSEWQAQVRHGFDSAIETGLKLKDAPPRPRVLAYFESRAPEELKLPQREATPPCPISFERRDFSPARPPGLPAIATVRFAHFSDDKKLDLLACDMFHGQILLLKAYEADPKIDVLCDDLPHPVHVEVVDLDADGIKDLLVANLGDFYPTNKKCGSVVWLRGTSKGAFERHVLLEEVGRVADVQSADLNGDGKLDLAVAAFGWKWAGLVFYLENHTVNYQEPRFEPRVLDGRHGAIHVPIVDINGDGRLDIVTLISQQHETIAAYLNDGKANFTLQTIFTGPHPAFGSSGIQIVDLNGDGRLDVLYTNGDSLDSLVLRPYHGVRWLENRGVFPFTEHPLTAMPGVGRAVAADFESNGRPSVLAVSMLPAPLLGEERRRHRLDSILFLRQTAAGQFQRHVLESNTCDHTTCDVGDFDADGKLDFATASFVNLGEQNPVKPDADTGKAPWISLWKNLGP